MGFKTVRDYNEERYGGMFSLRGDGDHADVIFMYQKYDDVLVADTHYIKSADYSGYVHCCGRGCPACTKGIRVQTKLFIPLYNITSGKIEFFDRSTRFEPQLHQDVFEHYPNPSEFVFRITRSGAPGDVNTTYSIVAVGRNTFKKFEDICVEHNATFPEYYNSICRDLTPAQLSNLLSTEAAPAAAATSSTLADYSVKPRVSASAVPQFAELDQTGLNEPDDNDVPFEVAEGDTDTSDVDNVDF